MKPDTTQHLVGISLVFLFILSTLLALKNVREVWYIFPVGLAALITLLYIYNRSVIVLPKLIVICLLVIYALFLFHGFRSITNIRLVSRVFIFVFISIVCIVLIPNTVKKHIYFSFLSIISLCVVLIGLPAAFFGEFSVLVFDLGVHRQSTTEWFGVEIYRSTSVLSNPNGLAYVAYFGLISSFMWKRRDLVLLITPVFVAGLLIANSRAAYLGTAVAVGTILIGSQLDDYIFRFIIMIGVFLSAVFQLIFFGIIPAPEIISSINFSGRTYIWEAGIRAFIAEPIIGHGSADVSTIVGQYTDRGVGAGIYNLFLRAFVATGVLGGLSYVILLLYPTYYHPVSTDSFSSLVIYAMYLGFITNEIFSGNSIFGLSMVSVVGATLLGYLLQDIVQNYHSDPNLKS